MELPLEIVVAIAAVVLAAAVTTVRGRGKGSSEQCHWRSLRDLQLEGSFGMLATLACIVLVTGTAGLASPMPDLSQRVCWVTGASSGIGRATAVALASGGARVILSARREDVLKEAAAECVAASPTRDASRIRVFPLDLSAPPTTLATRADEALKAFDAPVDLLVNKCVARRRGVSPRPLMLPPRYSGGISTRARAEDTDLEVTETLMRVNFLSAVALTKACLPAMLDRRRGDIVVVSSVQGRLAIPMRAAYAASKHACHGYFESLRAEVADRDLNVFIVCPGYVRTALSLNALTGGGERYGQMDATTAAGLDPSVVAREIIDGVLARKHESVLADLKSRIAILLRALLPNVLCGVMAKRYLKERDKAAAMPPASRS